MKIADRRVALCQAQRGGVAFRGILTPRVAGSVPIAAPRVLRSGDGAARHDTGRVEE
jgi:hypothetical protein